MRKRRSFIFGLLALITAIGVACSQIGPDGASTERPTPSAGLKGDTATLRETSTPAESAGASIKSATVSATPGPSPTAVTQVKFPGFDFQLSPGTFWDYRWEYRSSSFCRDCRGGPTIDSGTFRVTLGPPRVIQGVTAYEMQLAGKHTLESSSTDRSFGPRWRYMGLADNRILVSKDGATLVVLFDGQEGEWPGSGFFTTRFKSTKLFDGKASGQDVVVSASSRKGGCKYYRSIGKVCPGGTATDYTETEVYRPGIGPVGYSFRYSYKSGSGTTSFSSNTSEKVELLASSLHGDVASSKLEPDSK